MVHYHHHYHHHQSLNREGRWGTTDDFSTSFLHFSQFSFALWDLANSRPVHILTMSSHLFLCLPCLLPAFIVPYKMVLARPDERETRPYHCSLRLFTIVRGSSCGLKAPTIQLTSDVDEHQVDLDRAKDFLNAAPWLSGRETPLC